MPYILPCPHFACGRCDRAGPLRADTKKWGAVGTIWPNPLRDLCDWPVLQPVGVSAGATDADINELVRNITSARRTTPITATESAALRRAVISYVSGGGIIAPGWVPAIRTATKISAPANRPGEPRYKRTRRAAVAAGLILQLTPHHNQGTLRTAMAAGLISPSIHDTFTTPWVDLSQDITGWCGAAQLTVRHLLVVYYATARNTRDTTYRCAACGLGPTSINRAYHACVSAPLPPLV